MFPDFALRTSRNVYIPIYEKMFHTRFSWNMWIIAVLFIPVIKTDYQIQVTTSQQREKWASITVISKTYQTVGQNIPDQFTLCTKQIIHRS